MEPPDICRLGAGAPEMPAVVQRTDPEYGSAALFFYLVFPYPSFIKGIISCYAPTCGGPSIRLDE
jgi:hypothetical protein